VRLSLGRDTDAEHVARVVHVLRALQAQPETKTEPAALAASVS
jgi:hypothetical protein